MAPKFIVINRISTLRRLTVQLLKNLGYSDIHETADPGKVPEIIEFGGLHNGRLIIIQELTESTMSVTDLNLYTYLKNLKAKREVALLITSPSAEKKLVLGARRSGADRLIIKPKNLHKYSEKLEHVLEDLGIPSDLGRMKIFPFM